MEKKMIWEKRGVMIRRGWGAGGEKKVENEINREDLSWRAPLGL